MPSEQECGEVFKEVIAKLNTGLSHQAIGRLLAPGLSGLSPSDAMKRWRILTSGPQDEEELRLGTATAELWGTMLGQSASAFIQDLGLTEQEVLAMPVSEFQRLLEEQWIPELKQVAES